MFSFFLHTQDLLQSLTQVETNANLVVHGSGGGSGGGSGSGSGGGSGGGEGGTTERKHQKTKQQQSSVSVLCTAMTLYPRHVGVFRAVSGIIINCCTSRGNNSSGGGDDFSFSFTEEGVVELIVDALLAFPDDLFVQKLGLRALYVLCGGAKSVVAHGSDSVFETVATIVDHGGTEVCVFVICCV